MEKQLYEMIQKAQEDIQTLTEFVQAQSARISFIEDELSKISDKAFDDFKRQFED